MDKLARPGKQEKKIKLSQPDNKSGRLGIVHCILFLCLPETFLIGYLKASCCLVKVKALSLIEPIHGI